MSHSTPSGSWDEPYYRVHTEHFEAAFLPDADEDLDAVTDIDVEVQLRDGSRWSASMCTVGHVETLMERWAASGEALGGRYFWCSDGLIDLWERIAPLIPPRPPRRHRFPGRKPADDRTALAGIVYVLRKGVSWADVPAERIGCSGVTSWRRLRDWTEAGAWARLHEALLVELRRADLLDMDDCAIDGSHVRALLIVSG